MKAEYQKPKGAHIELSIQLNKLNSEWKRYFRASEQKGVKDDISLLRVVAQSKGNCVPFAELKKEAKNNSIYQTLDRLSPRVDFSPGKYLFCYDDLVKNHETVEAREKDLDKLVKKIEQLYNHFLQWQNWKKVKRVIKPKSNGNRVITIQFDKNNSIILKSLPEMKKDVDKAVLIFRKRFEPIEDLTKYTHSNSLIRWFTLVGKNNDRFSGFKIRKQYVTMRVPLIPKRMQGKLYFRTLSEESYSNLYSRRYLERVKTETGLGLGMNIKGLLLYALNESDDKELGKSLQNLAESDVYQEAGETVDTYNELGQTADHPIYFNYKVKRDFPFLAYYSNLKQMLPQNFATKVIKKVASGGLTIDEIKILPVKYLRYVTTKLFLKEIIAEVQKNNQDFGDNLGEAFRAYRSEITAYLAYLDRRALIRKQNMKILSDVEDRRGLLIKNLETIIKDNENRMNNEVIPIYEIITQSRLSSFDISEVLKFIAKTHKRYMVTDKCLIPRSKRRELESSLRDEPTYEYACLSLVNHGVPRNCISEQLFHELGFEKYIEKIGFQKYGHFDHKKKPKEIKTRVYYDNIRKVVEIK